MKMKNVVFALFASMLLVGCAGARIYTPPTAISKLPCAVVFEDKDEESGQEFVGLMCVKEGLLKAFAQWENINAWQKNAWQKCGPKDDKTK
jgi:hypothetical protein